MDNYEFHYNGPHRDIGDSLQYTDSYDHSSPEYSETLGENPDLDMHTQPDNLHSENVHFNIDNDVIADNTSNSNNEPWYPSIVTNNENLNLGNNDNAGPESSPSYEDSNQSVPMLPVVNSTLIVEPWRPGLGLGSFDDNSNSAQPQSAVLVEDTRSTVITVNDESNSSSAYAECEGRDDVDEPPAKVRKLSSNDEGDGESCPICLDSWENSGEHRLVSLKCGHLFGAACVQRWLKAQPAKDRSCPTCKSKATLRDMRYIYARKLVAVDTSRITELKEQMEILQAEKNRTELELQKSRIAHRACVLQLEGLRNSLLKSQAAKEQPARRSWRFALEKNLEVCKDGGCRVLTYNCRTYEFYVSQKSTNGLFPGYGIRKVSCVDYKPGQFVHLHPKPIRDMTYSQPRDLLLSVGLDNTARIVERGVPSASIQCRMPLWSCSWDYLRSNEFYVGGVGGVIDQYDVRSPGAYIKRMTATGDLSPVVSLCSTEHGLLSCQLNSCWLWEPKRQWEPRALPVDGPFMSLCYDNESHRVLVSTRASGNERSKLTLCKLKTTVPNGDVVCDVEQTFAGSARSSLMSRSAWVRPPGASWVAAHSEAEAALFLHGLDGARTMVLPAAEPVLDVCTAQLNGDTILAALSESRLRLYRAVSTS